MIEGAVDATHQAVVPLTVEGPTGQAREIAAVVDTGFSDYLTLPAAFVSELGLAYRTRDSAILADGSEAFFDVYDIVVLWDGHPRHVYTYATDATPLVGMRMLDSHDLSIQVRTGGRVVIQAGE